MDYATFKSVHIGFAMLSFGGFALRSGGVMAGTDWARGRAAKILVSHATHTDTTSA